MGLRLIDCDTLSQRASSASLRQIGQGSHGPPGSERRTINDVYLLSREHLELPWINGEELPGSIRRQLTGDVENQRHGVGRLADNFTDKHREHSRLQARSGLPIPIHTARKSGPRPGFHSKRRIRSSAVAPLCAMRACARHKRLRSLCVRGSKSWLTASRSHPFASH